MLCTKDVFGYTRSMQFLCGLGRTWIRLWFFLCWLAVIPAAFGTSEVLQQFNAIASSDTFRASGTPPDPHGAVGPKGILASVNLGLEYYTKSTNHTTVWVAPLANNLVSSGTNAF